MRTRDEHLEWCKQQAHEYLDQGDIHNAVTSMLSDLSKHPETKNVGEKLAPLGIFYIMNNDHQGARRFIDGFR
jgi:hypothetical protein